jgi:membrane protein implicated in regulation of membrane protease activity
MENIMNLVRGFFRFWYDFIVGDSVVLAIGGGAVLVAGALLVWAGAEAVAQVLLPVMVAGTLALSLPRPRDRTEN